MINISKQGDSIVFSFDNNDRYLQNGQITVPVNSLSLSFDKSGFATFKKAATNDVFLEFFPENSNLATKENVINFYVNNMVNIDGGGSSGEGISDAPSDGKLYGRKDASWTEVPSGITAEDVDSKIATAVADLATDADLQAVSGKVDENTAAISSKQDILVSGENIKTVNGKSLLGNGDITIQGGGGVGQTYSGSTNGEIFNNYTNNVASGRFSHAEGNNTIASGFYSHAEGQSTSAVSVTSHAEGQSTIANRNRAHAEGMKTQALNFDTHAEGTYTIANNGSEHAQGKYNESHTGSTEADKTIHSIGIGTSKDDRKNAHEVMTNGDTYIYGIGGYDGKNYLEAQTVQEVISALTEASGSTSGGSGITDAPSDGKLYGRKNASWTEVPSAITASDVDSKIATAVADLATDADLQAVSGKVDENTAAISGKQDTLVSGTNIKSVNGETLLGSGDITIQSGVGQNYQGSQHGEIFNDMVLNQASGVYSHAEGNNNKALGSCAHAEGQATTANGTHSHAEGSGVRANGDYSHAEGFRTTTNNEAEHAQGKYNKSNTGETEADNTLHSIGIGASFSDGKNAQEVMTNGDYYVLGVGGYDGTNYTAAQTVQEVISTLAEASGSTGGGITAGEVDSKIATAIASKQDTLVSGENIKTVNGESLLGSGNITIQGGGGVGKTFQGSTNGEIFNDYTTNVASGSYSHAEGELTQATDNHSHAEGWGTMASSSESHAEGYRTKAQGQASHSEGYFTIAQSNYSHAEGLQSEANGGSAHAEGSYTIANNESEHAQGKFNVSNSETIHSIGIGTFLDDRKNAQEVMTNGDTYIYGIGGYNGKNYSEASTLQEVISALTESSGSTSGGGITSGDVQNQIDAAISGKQDTLVSGTNIKTVNGESLLGSGDISIQGGGVGQNYQGSTNGEIFNDYSNNVASGEDSHAEGKGTTASGNYSHAEGRQTIASGDKSHAEGYYTKANGSSSHAEGTNSMAIGLASHAEGQSTTASGDKSHAEGQSTTASGDYSHAEGSYTLANNESEHAQGKYNKSNTGSTEADNTIHSIGIGTSEDDRKNAQEIMTNGDTYIYGIGGYDGTNYTAASTVQEVISALTESSGSTGGGITAGEVDSKIDAAIASKQDTLVSGTNIKTINGQSILGDGNINITVSGSTSGSGVGQTYQGSQYGEIFNDYTNNVASGNYSHAEGQSTSASGWSSHAEGSGTKASGRSSHAEGNSTVASGDYSHAEGIGTTASGSYSHAEGRDTIASDEYSHAEGNSTSASSQASHAEGYTTNASGEYSHAEGSGTIASGQCSHAEGFSTSANGLYSHVEGNSTIANNAYEHAQGKYNKSNTGSTNDKRTIHSIGIGMGDTSRKNAVEVMTNGDAYIYGIGGYDGTNYSQSSTVQKMFNSKVNLWKGSQSEYDGLGSYDLGTLYVIKDSFTITKVYLGDVVLFGA